ncbi:MAG TPA: sigma-70 family RNA polymerase sigma factor [Polyangia bacterium]
MDFRGFYDEHVALVWRALFRLGVPKADLPDAVQEVFLVAYRKLPEFEGRSKSSTWLVGICFRVASDRRRLAHVRREVGDANALLGCGDDRPGADQLMEQQERAQVLDEILALLRPEQREVFVMFELEDLSGKEIAAIVGAPIKTVFSRLRLARAAFTTVLETRNSGNNLVASRAMPVTAAVGKGPTP